MRASRNPRAWALAALAGLVVASVCALAAPLGWPFELFSHFQAQYAVAGLLLAMLLLSFGSRRAAALAGMLAAFHALPVLQRTAADPTSVACAGSGFTVVTANLQFSNPETGRFVDWLAANPADLVVLQEVTASWAQALRRVRGYPHRTLLVREDPYGIGVLSRWPLESVEPRDLVGDGLPSLAGRVPIEGRGLRFVALHTHWPVLPGLERSRDRSLASAAGLIRSATGPAVALGDLNVTPYSPVFGRFLAEAGLRDAVNGSKWQPTWMAGFWPLSLRIDHVLVSPDLCVEHAEVGPPLGSDHRPVIARLRFAAPRSVGG